MKNEITKGARQPAVQKMRHPKANNRTACNKRNDWVLLAVGGWGSGVGGGVKPFWLIVLFRVEFS